MIKIGIIGPTWINDRIKRSIKRFPIFDPLFKTSNNIYDAPIFTEELQDQCDVLLYSGYIPYSISKKKIPIELPAHYIPVKGSSLYRAFYKLQKQVHEINNISIDTLSRKELEHLNGELDETIESIHYDDRLSLTRTKEIVEFHEAQYRENKTDCALTGLKLVSDELTLKGIPNEWIIPTEEDIIVTLERALLSTEQRKKIESQIVFGIVSLENIEQVKRRIASEQHIQRLFLQVQQTILDYVETLEGYLTSLNGNEYMFVTTRGTFERVTQGYKFFPLIDDLKKEFGLAVSVGIGFGTSAIEAGNHARMALMQANDFGGEKCFIVKEDRSVFGPIENEAPIAYPLKITDEKWVKQTAEHHVSPHYLKKALAIMNRTDTKTFTAQELASSLGVTTRSAHRILLTWLDARIVEIVGMEKLQSKGRPRQVYKLLS